MKLKPMVLVLAMAFIVCARSNAFDESAISFPYEVVVADRTASIFSGPSETHYACDRLGIGKRLEVYRHDPDGMLAIRPPMGSFSLIPADAVARTEEPGVAVIRNDDTKAWVGTRLDNPATPLWQVRLRQGERVEVIGEQMAIGRDGRSIRWLRISPPAGEFRWVRAGDVTRYEPIDVSSGEGPSSSLFPNHVDDETDSMRPDLGSNQIDSAIEIESDIPRPIDIQSMRTVDDAEIALVAGQTDERAAPPNSTEVDNAWPDGFVSRSGSRQSGGLNDVPQRTNQDLDSNMGSGVTNQNQSQARDATDAAMNAVNFEDRVLFIESSLTRLAILPIEQWDVQPISAEARHLATIATTESQRRRVNQLLTKVQRFESLQVKREAFANVRTEIQRNGNGLGSPSEGSSDLPSRVGDAVDTYAGTGILNRLVTERGLGRGAYVLQDEAGRIINVVAPSPGVNLERYLQQHVALQGKTGTHERYEKPLILADRVILLNRHR